VQLKSASRERFLSCSLLRAVTAINRARAVCGSLHLRKCARMSATGQSLAASARILGR
jgi:hypothetical protein